MKVREFVRVLDAYATAVAAHGDHGLSAMLAKLKKAWSKAMLWNVKDLVKRAMPQAPVPKAQDAAVAEFRKALMELESIVESVGKKGFNDDLALLIEALEPHDKDDLAGFIEACALALKESKTQQSSTRTKKARDVDEDIAQHYAQRLKKSHKDPDQFVSVYEELLADRRLRLAELARIATLLAYKTAPTTKKSEVLRRIWLIHEAYASSAAKSKFSRGRSAA